MTTEGCSAYRLEMRLLGLRKRLAAPDLGSRERAAVLQEIRNIEEMLGLD